ncbi:uncharacterized protein LOC143078989 isoform X2 [Mytilus galloprovincialis]|uniref:uncharacterized protein LOC143078989 isoform X2 n=1 Tax=Mytilus galloprovincialis TaxID=29158 RepID=UPI003F7BDDFD
MAAVNPLDDILNSSVDELAINALVGNLEARLASPSNKDVSNSLSDASVNNNHIGTTRSSTPQNSGSVFNTATGVGANGQAVSAHKNFTNSHNLNVQSPSSKTDSQLIGINSILNPMNSSQTSNIVNTHVNSLTVNRSSPIPESNRIQSPHIIRTVSNSPGFQNARNSPVPSPNSNPAISASSQHAIKPDNSAIIQNVAISGDHKPLMSQGNCIQVSSSQQIPGGQNLCVKQEPAISSQYIVKTENMPVSSVKNEPRTAAIQAVTGLQNSVYTSGNHITHATNVHIVNAPIKGHSGVITVKTGPQHVVMRPQIVQNSGQMQVVNVSAHSNRPPGIVQVPHGKHQPVRIATPAGHSQINIAPRPGGAPRRQKIVKKMGGIQELPEEFRPSEWLTDTKPRKTPYVPQMGDEVMYFRQGHDLYLQAVVRKNAYKIDPNKNLPWHKMPSIREQELMRVVGIKYEVRPPRMVCLKLAFIDPATGKPTGGSISIKYHDLPDVIDFLVLRQNYDIAMQRKWKTGDRFRSMIHDAWWMGSIKEQFPFQEEHPDSMFQCFLVHWDNGETEKISPWDMEPIADCSMPEDPGGGVPVTQDEIISLMYTPSAGEWPSCSRDQECDRIIRGMEMIMEHSVAEPFLTPVDLNVFPIYGIIIEYPMDLTTIKSRLENRFYRRVNALQFDVRYIETNAVTFNEAGTPIVKSAKILTEALLRFINDTDCCDPMSIVSNLIHGMEFNWGTSDSDSDTEDTADTRKRKRNTITLPPGVQIPPGTVLMRNEQGQLMFVPALHASQQPTTQGQRIQYVRPPVSSHQQRPPNSQIVTIQPQQAQPPRVVRPNTQPSVTSSVPTVVSQPPSASQGSLPGHHQQPLDNVKKCKNFLSTLIKLAEGQPEQTVKNVRELIQGLIDNKVEPEQFTERLQKELKSSPQPYLVPFLKKSLPHLRQSLLENKMHIEGVKAPPIEVMKGTAFGSSNIQPHPSHIRFQQTATNNTQRLPQQLSVASKIVEDNSEEDQLKTRRLKPEKKLKSQKRGFKRQQTDEHGSPKKNTSTSKTQRPSRQLSAASSIAEDNSEEDQLKTRRLKPEKKLKSQKRGFKRQQTDEHGSPKKNMSALPEQIQRLKQIVTEKANVQQQISKLKQQLRAIEQQELYLTNLMVNPRKASPCMDTVKTLEKNISPNLMKVSPKKTLGLFSNPIQPSTSGLQNKMPSNDVHPPVKQSASSLSDADSDIELAELIFEDPKKFDRSQFSSDSDAGIPLEKIRQNKKKLKLKRKIVITSSESEDGQNTSTKKSEDDDGKPRKKSARAPKKKKCYDV